MFDNNQVTKIVRRHLSNPNLNVESYSAEQDGVDGSDTLVYRIQGYVTDPIAYELEGTPMPFDIRFSLNDESH